MAGLLSTTPAWLNRDAVTDELRRWAGERFDLANANCGQSVVGYVGRLKGLPVPLWLRALGRLGALRLMRSDAALAAAADRAFGGMACPVTDTPQRGDVGIVRFPGTGLTTAICTGPCLADANDKRPLWAARGERGVVIQAAAVVKAWRVSCPAR